MTEEVVQLLDVTSSVLEVRIDLVGYVGRCVGVHLTGRGGECVVGFVPCCEGGVGETEESGEGEQGGSHGEQMPGKGVGRKTELGFLRMGMWLSLSS